MPRSRRSQRSSCPVACALDIVGDRWTFLIIRDLELGKETFQEMLESPEGSQFLLKRI
jgi:DNA-binding HxlR family transcriptional regulator